MSKKNDLRSNQVIREAIQKIALHGLVDPSTNTVKNTGRITGYVAKIHTDEGDELYGTIDVQEYSSIAMNDPDAELKIGYHEGVYLSALQDNSKGMVIIPKLYSEVTIVTDPETQTEYVSMFSHVDIIQLDSHDTISIGVKEREEFDEGDEESSDVDELEETGVYTNTTYEKNKIVTTVQDESDSDNVKVTLDGKKSETQVSDKSTLTTILINNGGPGSICCHISLIQAERRHRNILGWRYQRQNEQQKQKQSSSHHDTNINDFALII